LIHDDLNRIDQLTTQLSFRLSEGSGKCEYHIGVEDKGNLSCLNLEDLERSIVMLEMMVESISAKVSNIERIEYQYKESNETNYYAIISVESCYDDDTSKVDVRIAVCGNVDAGKSTCIGVMKTGFLDNGRGSARTSTMIHSHEIESGRTSTVSHHVIGYKTNGKITNYDQGSRQQSVDQITAQSVRLITFVDLAGHEKYLRTMIYGVSSCLLDYSLVLINCRSGVTHMTHHHLTVCAMMNIPILILFTKIDGCPKHRYIKTLEETRELLKAPDVRKRLQIIKLDDTKGSDARDGDDTRTTATDTATDTAEATSESITSELATAKISTDMNDDKIKTTATATDNIFTSSETTKKSATASTIALRSVLQSLTASRQVGIPAFPISFTEGTNLEFLRRICRFLPKRRKHSEKSSASLEFIIDRIYSVPGVGPVVYGFVNQGSITANKSVWFGPLNRGGDAGNVKLVGNNNDNNNKNKNNPARGEFIRTTVKTIHYNCLPVKNVSAGNFCTLAIKLDKNQIKQVRRGQVLMETAPIAVSRFQAKINIVYSQSTTIKVGYTPFLHILMCRQSAVVEKIETINKGLVSSSTNVDVNANASASDGNGNGKESILRPGDMSIITFRFMHRAEYIRENMRIMFRDGKVKGVGVITATLDD
jgi:GTPase